MNVLELLFPRAFDGRKFGLSEGWRRVCILLSGVLIAYWLVKAGMLQSEIWNCPYGVYNQVMCRDAVREIWQLVGLAAASPLVVSVLARVTYWIASGFRQARKQ